MFEFKQTHKGICAECGRPLIAVSICGNEKILPCRCRMQARGDALRSREAEAAAKTRARELRKFSSSVGERFRDKSFKDFRRSEQNMAHWNAIARLVKDFPAFLKNGRGLLVLGACGCGKTHMEVAAGKYLISHGFSVHFFKADSMFNAYRKSFAFDADVSPYEFIENACKCDLLILDDAGVHTADKDKGFEEFLYALIDFRYSQKKPLLASSNITEAQLDRAFSVRVADRLKAMTSIVVNKSCSMRKQEAAAIMP